MLRLRYLLIGLILGLMFGWLWFGGEGRSAPAAQKAAPVPLPRSSSRKTKDLLTEIEGVGPSYERALNELGIFTFKELAAQEPDELASRMSARVTAERIRREKWIEQARSLSQ